MWMLKGFGLGLIVFFIFFVVYYVLVIAGGLRSNVAIGISAITGATIHRPLFWLSFVLTLLCCCSYARLLHR
jgi:hypothetical protein